MINLAREQLRDYRACWELDHISLVLEDLDRLSSRAVGKQASQRRRSERKPYTASVLVTQNRDLQLPDGARALLHMIARNLSRSGLGLLAPLFFQPEVPSHESPLLRSQTIFGPGTQLEIGLQTQHGPLLWLSGTVIRSRIVQHDLLDVGVRFNSRLKRMEDLDCE